MLILTDGAPNDNESATGAIREAADLQIEVVALGIEDVRHPELFPRIELLKDVRELPEKTFRLLEGLLLKQPTHIPPLGPSSPPRWRAFRYLTPNQRRSNAQGQRAFG